MNGDVLYNTFRVEHTNRLSLRVLHPALYDIALVHSPDALWGAGPD